MSSSRLSASGFYSLYQLAETLQVCCFTGIRLSKAFMIRLVPARDEQSEFWFIPDPCQRLSGPCFYTVADHSLLNYHIKNKSPPLIPKIEQNIMLHPDTLELAREAQFLSVVQNLHRLIRLKKFCFVDHLPRKENSCMDLVLRICFEEQPIYRSSFDESLPITCQEENIFYRQLMLSSKRLKNALKYLNVEDTCLEQWKEWSRPVSIGCFRSYWSCLLLSEIEKWQYFEKTAQMT
ncbi:hypothetical protein GpartN1_g7639.t1 [Galdieria partita]|uniref:Uncharacterized protein n=1 Tax=Galdieria partita TaxID=83374 RepID=A0A9C7UUH8_9RHOD|nr:hypothetical protein GpartN1_g7639.t1 [Galdieria partita]